MVLPLLKLGTLALKTLSKPLASKLKQQAAIHLKFRQFIINIAQVISSDFYLFYFCFGFQFVDFWQSKH